MARTEVPLEDRGPRTYGQLQYGAYNAQTGIVIETPAGVILLRNATALTYAQADTGLWNWQRGTDSMGAGGTDFFPAGESVAYRMKATFPANKWDVNLIDVTTNQLGHNGQSIDGFKGEFLTQNFPPNPPAIMAFVKPDAVNCIELYLSTNGRANANDIPAQMASWGQVIQLLRDAGFDHVGITSPGDTTMSPTAPDSEFNNGAFGAYRDALVANYPSWGVPPSLFTDLFTTTIGRPRPGGPALTYFGTTNPNGTTNTDNLHPNAYFHSELGAIWLAKWSALRG